MSTPKIRLFADGSCSGKGRDVGAWAAAVVTENRRQLLYGTLFPTTINRCELIPIINGLKWIRDNLHTHIPIMIYTDSEHTAQAASGLFTPEDNLDLWASYAKVSEGLKIELKWRERNSHFYMELCDAMASTLRKGQIEISGRLFSDWRNPEIELPDNIELPEAETFNVMEGIKDAHSAFSGFTPRL
jgi:ribonuclease HI